MKVRFLAKSYFAGRIVEPGEIVDAVPEDTVLGPHMVKVEDPRPEFTSFREDMTRTEPLNWPYAIPSAGKP